MKNLLRDKSFLTNAGCIALAAIGYMFVDTAIGNILMIGGIFGFSGAVTNWLAIYMLFEKIPFLYGSGIIMLRFESFKKHIRTLIMGTFFSEENLQKHLPELIDMMQKLLTGDDFLKKIDMNILFDELVDTVESSTLGGMLSLVGGKAVLEGLRKPFCEKATQKIPDILHTVLQNSGELRSSIKTASIEAMIDRVVSEKLNLLTPRKVKEIVEKIIREHLGWLVFWGGFFGFSIGGLTALTGIL